MGKHFLTEHHISSPTLFAEQISNVHADLNDQSELEQF